MRLRSTRTLLALAAVVGVVASGCADTPSPLAPRGTPSADATSDAGPLVLDAGDLDDGDAVEAEGGNVVRLDEGDDSADGAPAAGDIELSDSDDASDAADADVTDSVAVTEMADEAAGQPKYTVRFELHTSRTTLSRIGSTLQLTTTAVSGGETLHNMPSVRWSSSNRAVLHVARGGLVTAIGPGKAKITAAFNWHRTMSRASVTLRVTGSGTPIIVPAQEATLPRVYLDTQMPVRDGRTLTVAEGGNLQAAIDSARYGDEVVLQAGATYTGNFILPAKSGTGWITIRTSAEQALPAPGVRVTAADAPSFARVVTPNSSPALTAKMRAHHYRLIGLEVSATDAVKSAGSLVVWGLSGLQNSLSLVPNWLVLDRSWVHGHDRLDVKRCITLNAASAAVIDSRVEHCHGRGHDTQAIEGWNGPGPFKIVNNYLADAAEVIMFGGANSAVRGLVPSDIEIRRNHIEQTEHMRGWLVKNLVELKTAQRVLIAENVIENVWQDGQAGFALNLKSSGDCSWCETRHVTVRDNYIANATSGISLAAMDAGSGKDEGLHHVVVRGNRFENLRARVFNVLGSDGRSMNDIIIEQNTGGAPKNLAVFDGAPTWRFRMRYNAFEVGRYGLKGSGYAVGISSLRVYAPGSVVTANALAGASAASYPAGNRAVATLADAPALIDGVRVGSDPSAGVSLMSAVAQR